jgi:hypothetical protein
MKNPRRQLSMKKAREIILRQLRIVQKEFGKEVRALFENNITNEILNVEELEPKELKSSYASILD